MDTDTMYDVVIIGGGPAGLSAAQYAARSRLNTLVLDKPKTAGALAFTSKIENYPGLPEPLPGNELLDIFREQAVGFGAEYVETQVTGAKLDAEIKEVYTMDKTYQAKALIIATGSMGRKPSITGEKEFLGRGVSYCAICDAAFFADLTVALVGGGNSAVYEALQLTKFASKVIVIHRRNELRATRIIQEKAFAEPKIEFLWNNIVERIEGEDVVKRLRLRNVVTGEESTLDVSGVFVSIGFKPNTDYLKDILPLDAAGYIVVNEKMETRIPGIFAAGDIRRNSVRQTITAAGDGATAASYAQKFIGE